MKTFLFYDLETTGLNKSFDQIIQFAAIRTDMTLSELDRIQIDIRLRPDIIPSPDAVITHRIPFRRMAEGETEYPAVCRIHRLLNTPGTISIGYNTLGFDDEFLRFSFYRNLLAPYTHQYANGCSRMDLLAVATVYRLFFPGLIDWPTVDGKDSLKLEHINAANGFTAGPSHDAMSDVETSIALARRLREEDQVWDYLKKAFDKKIDAARISRLPVQFDSPAGAHRSGLLVASEFGSEAGYMAPVLSIGDSIAYPNQSLWLRVDRPDLQETTEQSVGDIPWVIRKKMGEPGIMLPPAERYWEKITVDRRQLVGHNMQWLQTHMGLFQELVRYWQHYTYPDVPNLDPESALYRDGFFSSRETGWIERFHRSSWSKRLEMVEDAPSRRLRQLAWRIIYRNRTDDLSGSLHPNLRDHLAQILGTDKDHRRLDYRGAPRMTAAEAIGRIEQLRAAPLDPEQYGLLDELAQYIQKQFRADP